MNESIEWRHLLDDLHMLEEQRGREKGDRRRKKGKKGQGNNFVTSRIPHASDRDVGLIRARGRLGRFRIASCWVILPERYLMEWNKNWASRSWMEDCQDSNEDPQHLTQGDREIRDIQK